MIVDTLQPFMGHPIRTDPALLALLTKTATFLQRKDGNDKEKTPAQNLVMLCKSLLSKCIVTFICHICFLRIHSSYKVHHHKLI